MVSYSKKTHVSIYYNICDPFLPAIPGATPPRMRRRNHAPSAPPVRERDPLLEADREAERKYRELIREAEKLLVTVSRAPLEPPHNPRVRELRATEVRCGSHQNLI